MAQQKETTNLKELELPGFSLTGCGAPAAAHSIATLVRRSVCATLLETGVNGYKEEGSTRTPFAIKPEDPLFFDALVTTYKFHIQALWWVQHQKDASAIIGNEIATLYALREALNAQGGRD